MPLTNLPIFYQFPITRKFEPLSDEAYLYFDQQFQVLEEVISLLDTITINTVNKTGNPRVTVQGLIPPSLTTAEIASLAAATNPPTPLGTMWYDSDIKKLKFLADTGVVETITSTP